MRVIKYEAKDPFEGTAKIELPSRKNRLKLLKKHMGIFAKGEQTSAGIALYEDLYALANKIVNEVKITHVETKKKFKTFESMSEDSLCDEVCEEIIKVIMDGEKLGEA